MIDSASFINVSYRSTFPERRGTSLESTVEDKKLLPSGTSELDCDLSAASEIFFKTVAICVKYTMMMSILN